MELSTWYLLVTLFSIRNLPDCWVKMDHKARNVMTAEIRFKNLKSLSPSSYVYHIPPSPLLHRSIDTALSILQAMRVQRSVTSNGQ